MLGNTRERWGSVSIGLHWTIAILVLAVQVPAGVIMVSVDPGAVQNLFYNIHKTTGVLIFLLAAARLAWRWSNPVPALPADLPAWQAGMARTTHVLLYVVLFAMPVTGFLYTAMGGFPVPFFMLYDLARLVPENKPAAEVFKIGEAITAADGLQVKVNELRMGRIEGAEQVAAELLARGAGKAIAAPDFADAVNARIAAGVDSGELIQ